MALRELISGMLGLDDQTVLCAAIRSRRASTALLRLEKGRMRLLGVLEHEAGAGEAEAGFFARVLEEACQAQQASPDAVVWALSRKELLFKRFNLPLAARENLDWVVAIQIPNQLPVAADQLVHAYQAGESNVTRELTISLFALARERMEMLTKAAQAAGAPVARIVPLASLMTGLSAVPGRKALLLGEGGEWEAVLEDQGRLQDTAHGAAGRIEPVLRGWKDLPGGIHLLPGEAMAIKSELTAQPVSSTLTDLPEFQAANARQLCAVLAGRDYLQQRAAAFDLLPKDRRPASRFGPMHRMRLLAAALLVSMVLLGISMAIRHWSWNRAARKEMAALADDFAKADALRTRRQTAIEHLEAYAAAWPQRPSRIEWLATFSSLLPSDTWIGRINFNGDKVEIEGYSASAQQMIPLMENSGLLQKAAFSGPITKTQGEKSREVFRLSGELAGSGKSEPEAKP